MPEHDGDNDDEKVLSEVYGTIAKNVVRLRSKRQMSQQDLADKAGIARPTLYRIEAGLGSNLQNLIKLAKALDVSPADLFITDEQLEAVNYQAIKLLEKLSESLKR